MACCKRWLNWDGPSDETANKRGLVSQQIVSQTKITPWTKGFCGQQRPKVWISSPTMVTFPIERDILDRDKNRFFMIFVCGFGVSPTLSPFRAQIEQKKILRVFLLNPPAREYFIFFLWTRHFCWQRTAKLKPIIATNSLWGGRASFIVHHLLLHSASLLKGWRKTLYLVALMAIGSLDILFQIYMW